MATTPSSTSYIGYVERDPAINWGAVASDVIDQLAKKDEENAAFREKYDTIAAETMQELGQYDTTQSQDLDNFIFDGTTQGRAYILEMHNKLKRQQITPDQFNRMSMSVKNQWEDFNTITKNYDKALSLAWEGVNNGKFSSITDAAALRAAKLSDFKNKRLQWAPSDNGFTGLYILEYDENGNAVGDPTSMRTLKNTNNLIFMKADLDKDVKTFRARLGKYSDEGKIVDRERPEYIKWKDAYVDEVMAKGDKYVASILADDLGYEAYWEEDEVPDKGIKMITNEDGMWMPELTDDQRTAAEDKIKELLEQAESDVIPYRAPKTPKSPAQRCRDVNLVYNAKLGECVDPKDTDDEDELTAFKSAHLGASGDFTQMNNKNFMFEIDVKDGTITVANNKGDILLSELEIGTDKTAQQLLPYVQNPITLPEYQELAKTYIAPTYPTQVQTLTIEDISNKETDKAKYTPEDNVILELNNINDGDEAGVRDKVQTLLADYGVTTGITFGAETAHPTDSGLVVMEVLVDGKSAGFVTYDHYFTGKDKDSFKESQKTIVKAINMARGSQGTTTKKSIATLMKENPKLSPAEIKKLYENQ